MKNNYLRYKIDPLKLEKMDLRYKNTRAKLFEKQKIEVYEFKKDISMWKGLFKD